MNQGEKKEKVFSKEEVIESIKLFYDTHGKLPIKKQYDGKELPDIVLINKYGGVKKVRKMVTFELKEDKRANVIKKIQEFYERTGEVPKTKDFHKDNGLFWPAVVYDCFKSIGDALEAANLTEKRAGIKFDTKTKVIQAIKDFYEKNGRLPEQNEYKKKNGLPEIKFVCRLFGGRKQAEIEAGFKNYHLYSKYNPDDIMQILIDEYEKRGEKKMNYLEINDSENLPNYVIIKKLFKTNTANELWKRVDENYRKQKNKKKQA